MNLETLDSLPVGIFDAIPILTLYIGMTFTLLLSFEIGYQLCTYAKRNDKEGFTTTGPMVGGLLGMLAFVLAFTFSMAAEQHNLRKKHVLDEANIIGTAYLRADLAGDRDTIKIKDLLKEYVDVRVDAIKMRDAAIFKRGLERSQEIQDLLWNQVVSAAKREPSLTIGLLVQSINELIDSHQNRITAGFYNRIPSSVWILLLVISALTMMTMGAQAKLGKSRSLVAVIPLIMAFSALTTIVLDLDRPQEGLITVGQEALIDLQVSLNRK